MVKTAFEVKMVHQASFNTCPFPKPQSFHSNTDSQAELAAFAASRLRGQGGDTDRQSISETIISMLASAVLSTEIPWRRRPSMNLDGTPQLLSLKLSSDQDDAFRLLVEPGHLGMTVAEQIAFSLHTLDRLLGALSWRSAANSVNIIVRQLLPAQAQATNHWWGGIWLGTAGLPSRPELRFYINLRDGQPSVRWQRVSNLLQCFVHGNLSRELSDWFGRLAGGSPVGLGVALRAGRVVALRVYVSMPAETAHLPNWCVPISSADLATLTTACESFSALFGEQPGQRLTIGYDFLLDDAGELQAMIGRSKVELCCQMIDQQHQPMLLDWISREVTRWSFDVDSLGQFLSDIHSTWQQSAVDFVSLGFAPDSKHLTVYVKPGS